MPLEAVVLAGGLGTRLRALVSDVPKPMAPVGGRPFLEILLEQLASKGFSRVVLSLGHMAQVIRSHFGERYAGMTLVYSVETQPLGTGGALRLALRACTQPAVFVFNGDTFLDLEVAAVAAQWQAGRLPILVAREVPDTARYGRLEIEDGRISVFRDKGVAGPGLINAGCYLLPRELLEGRPDGPFSLESDFLVTEVQRQPFQVFLTRAQFIDIGVPEDYLRAQQLLAAPAQVCR